jgi:hypothetical protein
VVAAGAALAAVGGPGAYLPSALWVWPFVALLLAIALLPLIPTTRHWWEHNRNKLLVSAALAAVTLLYYGLRETGIKVEPAHGAQPVQAASPAVASLPAPAPLHRTVPGLPTVGHVLQHAVIDEYFPFLTLLFSLYVIAGGIVVRGDI